MILQYNLVAEDPFNMESSATIIRDSLSYYPYLEYVRLLDLLDKLKHQDSADRYNLIIKSMYRRAFKSIKGRPKSAVLWLFYENAHGIEFIIDMLCAPLNCQSELQFASILAVNTGNFEHRYTAVAYKKSPVKTFIHHCGDENSFLSLIYYMKLKYYPSYNKMFRNLPRLMAKGKDTKRTSRGLVIHTYLMLDERSGLYKIGRSVNVDYREKTLQSENPRIRTLAHTPVNIESDLHRKYSDKRERGEWFSLTKSDIKEVLQIFKQPKLLETA